MCWIAQGKAQSILRSETWQAILAQKVRVSRIQNPYVLATVTRMQLTFIFGDRVFRQAQLNLPQLIYTFQHTGDYW